MRGRLRLASEFRLPFPYALRVTVMPMDGPSQVRDWTSLVDSPEIDWNGVKTRAEGPPGTLPLTDEMLRQWPSGDLFGLSQNAGMGWEPATVGRRPVPDPEHSGGPARADGTPIALGYHTGHWEIGLLVQEAAEELQAARRGAVRRGWSPTLATAGRRARRG